MIYARNLHLLVLLAFFLSSLLCRGEWVLVPRGAWTGAHLGLAANRSLKQFTEGLEEGRAANEAMAAEFEAARQAYWSSYPDGPNIEEARKLYAEKLWERDLGYFLFQIPTGPSSGRGNLITQMLGPIGGGIGGRAGALMEPLIIAIRESYGAKNHTGWNADPVFPVNLHEKLMEPEIKAMYDRYVVVRDYDEYARAGHAEDFFSSPAEQFFYVYHAANNVTAAEAEQALKTMVDLVGEEAVREAMTRAWQMPDRGPTHIMETALEEQGLNAGSNHFHTVMLNIIRQREDLSDKGYLLMHLLPWSFGFHPVAQQKSLDYYHQLAREHGEDHVLETARQVRALSKTKSGMVIVDGVELYPSKAFQFMITGRPSLPKLPAKPEKFLVCEPPVVANDPESSMNQLIAWNYLPSDYFDGGSGIVAHYLNYVKTRQMDTRVVIDGKYLITTLQRLEDRNLYAVFDLESGDQVYEFRSEDRFLTANNGKVWFHPRKANHIRELTYRTGEYREISLPKGGFQSVELTDDGNVLLVRSDAIVLYDATLSQVLQKFEAPDSTNLGYTVNHFGSPTFLSGDTLMCYQGGDFPAALFYDIGTGQLVDTIYLLDPYYGNGFAFSDDHAFIGGHLYERGTGRALYTFRSMRGGALKDWSFILNNETLYAANGEVYVFDLKTGERIRTISIPFRDNSYMRFHTAMDEDHYVILNDHLRVLDTLHVVPLHEDPPVYRRAEEVTEYLADAHLMNDAHQKMKTARGTTNALRKLEPKKDPRHYTDDTRRYEDELIANRAEALAFLRPLGWIDIQYDDAGWTDFSNVAPDAVEAAAGSSVRIEGAVAISQHQTLVNKINEIKTFSGMLRDGAGDVPVALTLNAEDSGEIYGWVLYPSLGAKGSVEGTIRKFINEYELRIDEQEFIERSPNSRAKLGTHYSLELDPTTGQLSGRWKYQLHEDKKWPSGKAELAPDNGVGTSVVETDEAAVREVEQKEDPRTPAKALEKVQKGAEALKKISRWF